MNRIELPKPQADVRGSIQNLLELGAKDTPIRGVSIIRTNARKTRSNHYHKTDGHWLYVYSGEVHYWERKVDEAKYPQHPAVFKTGDLFYTGPLLWHKTYFPVETVLISLSIRPRDSASHEDDVVREYVP